MSNVRWKVRLEAFVNDDGVENQTAVEVSGSWAEGCERIDSLACIANDMGSVLRAFAESGRSLTSAYSPTASFRDALGEECCSAISTTRPEAEP